MKVSPLLCLHLYLGLLLVLFSPIITLGATQEGGDGSSSGGQDLVDQARQLITQRKFTEAVAVLTKALEVKGSREHYPDAYVQLGRAEANLGKLDKAESSYKQALALNEDFGPAHVAMGKLYLFQGRSAEAKTSMDRAVAADPENSGDALYGLARLEMQNSQDPSAKSKAEALYRQSLEKQPDNEQALFDLGVLLSQLGCHEEAAESFDKALRVNPTFKLTVLGQIYSSFNQLARAAEAYRGAVDKDPSDVEAVFGYAQVLEAQNKQQDATLTYQRVLELDPNHAAAHACLGMMLTGTGAFNYGAQQACGLNREEAKWHLHQAARINPQLKVANDSLEFCLKEEIEERLWSERLEALKARLAEVVGASAPPPSTSASHTVAAKGADGSPGAVMDAKAESSSSKEHQQAARPKTLNIQPLRDLRAIVRKLVGGVLRRVRCLMGAIFTRGSSDPLAVWPVNGRCIKSVPSTRIRSSSELMKYVLKNQPVIIKNFKDAYAPKEQWSREALRKRFGHMTVRVSLSETGRFDGPEDGTLWGLKATDEVLVRPPATSMRFGDFLDLIEIAAHPQGAEFLTETFYLEYLSLAQYLGPDMLAMIPMPKPAQEAGMQHLLTNFWMGKGNTTSPLHYDDYENLLCQIRGTKEIMLFKPSDLQYLYYTGRAKGHMEYEYPGTFKRKVIEANKYQVIFGSSVYLPEPDLKRHPLLVHATPYKVVLQPGDVLYLPPYWHHEVKSHPDEDSLNIAVNYWFSNETHFAEEEILFRRPTQRSAAGSASQEL